MRAAGKHRSSLLIGFQTEAMRRAAIQGGLVIGAQLYEARQFERSLKETQCFNCQQWGHTQTACAKPARCGRCAGPHPTRDCKEEKSSCANCGQKHPAWHRYSCRAFQTYHDRIQLQRVALIARTASIRSAPKQQLEIDGWTTITNKRRREPSPPQNSQPQRRVGRPTNIERAARAPSQGRISFAGASQTTSTQNEMDTTPIPQDE